MKMCERRASFEELRATNKFSKYFLIFVNILSLVSFLILLKPNNSCKNSTLEDSKQFSVLAGFWLGKLPRNKKWKFVRRFCPPGSLRMLIEIKSRAKVFKDNADVCCGVYSAVADAGWWLVRGGRRKRLIWEKLRRKFPLTLNLLAAIKLLWTFLWTLPEFIILPHNMDKRGS